MKLSMGNCIKTFLPYAQFGEDNDISGALGASRPVFIVAICL